MTKIILAIIFILFNGMIVNAQTLGSFEIDLPAEINTDVPVTVDISHIKAGMEKMKQQQIVEHKKMELRQIVDGKEGKQIPFESDSQGKTLIFIADKGGKQTYRLSVAKAPSWFPVMANDKDGALTIYNGNSSLLRYEHKTVYPPTGIDTNYKRSGFIHPLWTPHGQVLTRIQPPDHYHHYGIWNPWTHTLFENDTVDFWNIKAKQGTVRFVRFNNIVNNPVYTEFKALHEHVVFKKDGTEKVALNEILSVRTYRLQPNSDHYIVDITSTMSCASSSPLLLLTYRYGGLGWRATEEWDKNNCEVLTSEGKTRKDTDGSKGRWCIVQGNLGNDYGGALIMSHPDNYNHPEPMRIWDEKANGGRGDMFFNFSPTKDKDWLLEPGKTYVLKYRLIVFNGKMDAARAEAGWKYFATPVRAVATK